MSTAIDSLRDTLLDPRYRTKPLNTPYRFPLYCMTCPTYTSYCPMYVYETDAVHSFIPICEECTAAALIQIIGGEARTTD